MGLPYNQEKTFEDDLEHLIQNCGFPTFDEFKKNPDKWRRGAEDLFESIEGSSQVFKKRIKETQYYWKDEFRCQSLEQLQRVAKEEGYQAWDLEMIPRKKNLGGTSENQRLQMVIEVWPKSEIETQGGKTIHVA